MVLDFLKNQCHQQDQTPQGYHLFPVFLLFLHPLLAQVTLVALDLLFVQLVQSFQVHRKVPEDQQVLHYLIDQVNHQPQAVPVVRCLLLSQLVLHLLLAQRVPVVQGLLVVQLVRLVLGIQTILEIL